MQAVQIQQPSDYAEALISLAAALAPSYDTTTMRTALHLARPLAADLALPTPRRGARHHGLSRRYRRRAPPQQPSSEPSPATRRAEQIGNLWAAWLACGSINAIALARSDSQLGLVWSRRLISLQDRLGARVILPQYETYADFLALQGNLEHAVRVLAASHQASHRAGAQWPRNTITPQLLAHAEAQLPADQFTKAWTTGPTLTRLQLLDGNETL